MGIVKVETNAGIYGSGECSHGEEVLDIVGLVADHIVGENPLDADHLTELLAQKYTGASGIGQTPFTGIETALRDIKGKVLNAPLYELFGGKYRDEVLVYVDTHAGESVAETAANDSDSPYRPAAYAEAAREVFNEGFEALKFNLDVPTPDHRPQDTDGWALVV